MKNKERVKMIKKYKQENPFFSTSDDSIKIYLNPENRIVFDKNSVTINEYIELLQYLIRNENITSSSIINTLNDSKCLEFALLGWDIDLILKKIRIEPSEDCSEQEYVCYDLHAFAEQEEDVWEDYTPYSKTLIDAKYTTEDMYLSFMNRGDIIVPPENNEMKFKEIYNQL